MLKRITILAFALVVVAGFAYGATQSSSSTKASTTSSASKNTAATTTTDKSSSSKMASTKVEGTIQNVDLKAHTITVTVGTDTKTYKFGTKTMFMNDKKHAKATELKAGDKVTLTVDSKNYAHKVDVVSATAAQ